MEAKSSGSRGWKYAEGVDGQYTCAECGNQPYRSGFMIEATDLEGNLCVERDQEGRLQGRCYECCRGRGRHGTGEDIYAHLVDTRDEEMLANIFRRECNKRHNKRSGVRKNDHVLLKIKEWKELLAKVIEEKPECLHE